MASRVCVGAMGAVGLLAAGAAAGQGIPEAYTLVELVPAAGQPNSRALAVNDLSEVAGWSGLAGSSSPVFSLATVWDQSALPTDFALSFGASSSIAQDINTNGTSLIRYVGGSERVAVRVDDGTLLTLPDPSGDTSPQYGTRISESDAVGATYSEFGDRKDGQVVLWQRRSAGMTIDTTDFVSASDGGVMAPNGTFVLTGTDSTGGTAEWERYDPRDGSLVELGPEGDFSIALDASSSGYVVGESDNSSSAIFAFVSTPDGRVLSIPGVGCEDTFAPDAQGCFFNSLNGVPNSVARGVSESGIVVGQTASVVVVGEGDDEEIFVVDNAVAFIWSESTGTIELSTLIPDGSADGWELNEATDINNAGVVVGNGINPMGQERGFILIPRPRCAGDVNADGDVDSADFFAWVNAFGSGCD